MIASLALSALSNQGLAIMHEGKRNGAAARLHEHRCPPRTRRTTAQCGKVRARDPRSLHRFSTAAGNGVALRVTQAGRVWATATAGWPALSACGWAFMATLGKRLKRLPPFGVVRDRLCAPGLARPTLRGLTQVPERTRLLEFTRHVRMLDPVWEKHA
jgi:hypothetical protein